METDSKVKTGNTETPSEHQKFDAVMRKILSVSKDELKKREKDQLDLLTNRLQSDLAALSLEAVASTRAPARFAS